ncbi:MAG: Rrf2 family transcriptional regulator [Chitinophagales bacterium]|nr:Rrf2 family transcriptional regulator [Chitinophagales bacterium]
MLSHKAKYGLKAAFYLARHYDQGPVLISELASAEYIPKKFLENILLELKKQGILYSRMGKGGGYSLAKAPGKIYLGQIIRVLDGPLAAVQCVSKSAYVRCVECKDERTCEIRKVMKHVRDATAAILDRTSLEDAMHANLKVSKLTQNRV